MKARVLILAIVSILIFVTTTVPAEATKPLVQMAILLDTSGSMEGLIDQAKAQLWKIVNELALSNRDGKDIELQVALYEYGKSSIPAKEGHLRMIAPLTTDLDLISEELFKLKTNGGDEYCGTVILSATNGLKWVESNDELKLVFIAGNEPFTQGKVDYLKACKAAITKGIVVNTIFCGEHNEGIQTDWKKGADLADGKYMSINHNHQVVEIEAPQDEELAKLGRYLNDTYLAYGRKGNVYRERQLAQDSNATKVGKAAMAQRAMAKASTQYTNAVWDIVDAEEAGQIKLDELKEEELPEELKKLTKEEREAYVEKMRKDRKELQAKINKLNEERRKFIAEKAKEAPESTLDAAMIQAIREQAQKKNYQFAK